jgi:hypothetical protein
MVMELRDAAATRPALDKVMTALKTATVGDDTQMPWDETTAHAAVLRTVRVGDSTIAPSYTTTERFLVVASTPDATRELLGQAARGAATLTANDQYRAAMVRLPDNGVAYTFCDLNALYPRLHGLARSLMQHGGQRLGVALAHLPAAATVQKHLSPFVSARVSTPERDLTRSYSPFGSPLAVFVWGAGGQVLNLAAELSPPTSPSTSSDRGVPPLRPESQTAESPPPGPE